MYIVLHNATMLIVWAQHFFFFLEEEEDEKHETLTEFYCLVWYKN